MATNNPTHARIKSLKALASVLQLMHSQTLLELPEDLAKKWLVVPFPHGKRVVVMTKEGETHIYSNKGVWMMSFPSVLPGGNKKDKDPSSAEETILDCVLDKNAGIIYIFDMLSWKGSSVKDSTAEFRLMWLKSKIDEIPSLSEKTLLNPYQIKTLTVLPATKENIQQCLQEEMKAYGLMFYHKEGHYTPGNSPQLLWLSPYMAEEVLEVVVPEHYMEAKPKSYIDFATFVEKTKEQNEKREKIRQEAEERRKEKQKESQQSKGKGNQEKGKNSTKGKTKTPVGNSDKAASGGNKTRDKQFRPIRRAIQSAPSEERIRPIGRGRGGPRGQNMDYHGYQGQRVLGLQNSYSGYNNIGASGSYPDYGNSADFTSRMSGLSFSDDPLSKYGGGGYGSNYDMRVPSPKFGMSNYAGDNPYEKDYRNQNGLLGEYGQGYGASAGSSFNPGFDASGPNLNQAYGTSGRSPNFTPGYDTLGRSNFNQDYDTSGRSNFNQGYDTSGTSNFNQGYDTSGSSNFNQGYGSSGRSFFEDTPYPDFSREQNYGGPQNCFNNQGFQQNQGRQFNDGIRRRQTVAERLRTAKKLQSKTDGQKSENKDQKNSQKAKKDSHDSSQPQRTQLMVSQWLTTVPEDFETDWLMVLSPVGQHCRVVAKNGITVSYNKKGKEFEQFKSQLPGGNEHFKNCEENHTVLDCIYSSVNKTFYILDIMCWKGQPLCGCETGFRFHWLHLQLKEHPNVREEGKLNKYPFVPLSSVACNKTAMETFLATDHGFQVNGILFYRKTCRYVSGTVPDVLWLRPYMLPEVLDIQVPESYSSSKPPSYVDFLTHLRKYQEKHAQEKLETEAEIENVDDKPENVNIGIDQPVIT